jgi:SAM-dependent methyltransferase
MTNEAEASSFLSSDVERSGGAADRPVPGDFVTWAYRLFLDRDPESPDVVERTRSGLSTSAAVRRAFMSSAEFGRKREFRHTAGMAMGAAPLTIDVEVPDVLLDELLAHTSRTWAELGRTEPYWSVLSAERYRSDRVSSAMRSFEASGQVELERRVAMLSRNGIAIGGLRTCLEYGCGVGRVTRWLAGQFEWVCAVDISAPHLELAREYLASAGRSNVGFVQLRDVSDLEALPQVDLVYTILVLQHNPPPIIALTLRHLLGAIAHGGAAIFQLPTYSPDYSFRIEEYLRDAVNHERNGIEMHALPQRKVFEIIAGSGCEVVEVSTDDAAGPGWISNTFLVRKL